MVPNPSHLDAVNPVAMGKARARMLTRQSGPYHKKQNDKGKVNNITWLSCDGHVIIRCYAYKFMVMLHMLLKELIWSV